MLKPAGGACGGARRPHSINRAQGIAVPFRRTAMSSAAIDGRLALLVGGGPAPGINGVISAVTIEARNHGTEVIGIQDGFQWLMTENAPPRWRPLDIKDVKDFALRGGSMLGTSRANPTKSPEDMDRVLRALKGLGVTALVTIGGDDT